MLHEWVKVFKINSSINIVGKVKNIATHGEIWIEDTTLALHRITLGEGGYTSISIIDDESDEYMELEADLRHAKAGVIMHKSVKHIVAALKEIEQLGMPVSALDYCDMLTDRVVDTWDSQ